ncbi:MAG TPA: hypothetical protein VK923_09255 [Euzebyales bacterium]|nr:hypothetical protein [Euzebyales bacterium]
MTSETIGLLAAILFLLIAVVGGGFTVKELSIPRVPSTARILAGLLGVLFAMPFALSQARLDGGPEEPSKVHLSAAHPSQGTQDGGQAVLWADDQPDITKDSIQLLELEATSPDPDPAVGDRITITFTIKNVAQTRRELASTFVGARDPADEWSDFGEGNQSRVLQPGETLSVRTSLIPNEPGTWKLWPCYAVAHDDGERLCPDEWRAFPIDVIQ